MASEPLVGLEDQLSKLGRMIEDISQKELAPEISAEAMKKIRDDLIAACSKIPVDLEINKLQGDIDNAAKHLCMHLTVDLKAVTQEQLDNLSKDKKVSFDVALLPIAQTELDTLRTTITAGITGLTVGSVTVPSAPGGGAIEVFGTSLDEIAMAVRDMNNDLVGGFSHVGDILDEFSSNFQEMGFDIISSLSDLPDAMSGMVVSSGGGGGGSSDKEDKDEKKSSGEKKSKKVTESSAKIRKKLLELNEAAKKAGKEGLSDEIIDRLVASMSRFDDEIDKVTTAQAYLNEKLKDAKSEFDRFMDGLGKGSKGLTAVGVAALYAGSKVIELGENLVKDAKKFAEFDMAMATLASVKFFPGGVKELENVRSALGLTTEQFQAFINVSGGGVVSTKQMISTFKDLQDTFGPNPTKQLENYVELMKSMPSLEKDMKVNVNMDKKAADFFALAKAGKAEQFIELRRAGKFGGTKEKMPGSEDALKLLNAEQKGLKLTENINKTVSKFFPPSLAGITQVVGGVSNIVKELVVIPMTLYTVFGKLSGSFDKGTQKIVDAIEGNAPSGVDDVKDTMFQKLRDMFEKHSKKVMEQKGFKAKFKMGKSKIGAAWRMGKSALTKAGGIKGLAKGGLSSGVEMLGGKANLLKIGKGIGAGLGAAGLSIGGGMLKDYAEKNLDEGSSTKGIAQATGALMEIAGDAWAGAQIGAMVAPILGPFAPLGPAIGATVGGLYGIVKNASVLKKSIVTVATNLSDMIFDPKLYQANKRRWEADKKYIKANKEIKKTLEENRKMEEESIRELQRDLQLIDAVASDAAVGLADLNIRVSKVNLDVLASAGGSAKDFSDAVRQGVDGVTNKMSRLSQSFAETRQSIIANAKDSDQLSTALLSLKEK